ncbi:MAG TPA: class III poly(R)-hydroxyalkanoic acid synthase subunit PhaE [Lysobacter sp.]|nr:class III poly(R)-hydroxyalkanoic acid synthase subunit PhaE [Lysobacter sp.]
MGSNGFDDFEQLARQYWNAWGNSMRAGATPAQPSVPGWNEALGWWSQLAKGTGTGNKQGVDDAVDRFNSQARHWFGQMQQLAAQFAGKNASASDVAAAWQRSLGASGTNPFADLFKSMQGPGQHGVEQWMEQMAPLLQSMQRDGRSWLGLPAFGFAREHQERWQELAQAQLDFQEKSNAYNALMAEATQQAFRRFEDKLAERSEPGRQIASARALFDLWIDAAEDAYAEIALSPRFRQTYGDFINAQMRVRAGVQSEIEQYCSMLGVPTRTEIDAAHRKIVQLERELRRMRDALQERESTASPAATSKPAAKAARKPASTKPVAKKVASPKTKGARR